MFTVKPTRPDPKFKVGDKTTQGIILAVKWAQDCKDYPHWANHAHYHYWFEEIPKIWDECNLKLAPPEEEWKDVTSECTARISKPAPHWIVVKHPEGSGDLFLFGSRGIQAFSRDVQQGKFKIEEFPTGGHVFSCGGFKVWKKVS